MTASATAEAAPQTCPYSGKSIREQATEMRIEREQSAKVPDNLRGLDPSALRMMLTGELKVPLGTRLAPSPRGSAPIVGHIAQIQEDPIDFLMRTWRECGDVVRYRFGSITAHLVTDPELVHQVLVKDHRIFSKQTRGQIILRLVLGRGLLTSEGDFWKRQRRIAQPAFHKKRVEAFGEAMVRAGDKLCENWQDGQTIDLNREMMKVTLQIVSETLLGSSVDGKLREVGDAVGVLLDEIDDRVGSLVSIPMSVPTPKNVKLERAMARLDDVVLSMIAARRAEGGGGNDLLGMLMDAIDEETGDRMTDAQLRDEVMTMFLAGHETTANALTWVMHLLSKSPHHLRLVQEELKTVLDGRTPTVADLRSMTYLGYVLQETLRLYPPAPMLARSPNQDTTLGGYHIPKGSLVFVAPYVTQRHPDHWEKPEGFDPERFTPERSEGRARFAYFPFGAGPRKCIGESFAMMESMLLLATILQRWELDGVPGAKVIPEAKITLRPKGGLPMVARKR